MRNRSSGSGMSINYYYQRIAGEKMILILMLFFLVSNGSSQTKENSIVILVDSVISNGIVPELNIFKSDLEIENYKVILKTSTFQTPEEVRGYLQALYNSTSPKLIGAILMGRIPLARQHFIMTYTNPNLSPTNHNGLSTQFFSDLNGNFYKNNPEYPESYSEHDGDTISEIWVSVLPFYQSNNNTIIEIKQYLDKNHKYRNGNINILSGRNDGFRVKILNPDSNEHTSYVKEVEDYMRKLKNIDIFVASAGFDQGIEDWGHLLYPEDYLELGKLMKEYSTNLCDGRRYGLLEGGYNHDVLPINVNSFCEGFK